MLTAEKAVAMTVALPNELVRQKVKVTFRNERHDPINELIPCSGSHVRSLKIKMQIGWPDRVKEEVWTEIVAEKFQKQRQLPQEFGLIDEAALLGSYLSQLLPGDTTNREGTQLVDGRQLQN